MYWLRTIQPFTHWWRRLLPCQVPTCSSGAIQGSVSCSRMLRPAARGSWESNQRPSKFCTTRSPSWAKCHPIIPPFHLLKLFFLQHFFFFFFFFFFYIFASLFNWFRMSNWQEKSWPQKTPTQINDEQIYGIHGKSNHLWCNVLHL